MTNVTKIISHIHRLILHLYWIIVVFLSLFTVFLAVFYYANHYKDPEIFSFPEFLTIAATLNLNEQEKENLKKCLTRQDASKIYPSTIIKDCLSKSGAKIKKVNGHYTATK